ncbi:MAG: SulP family inorganic anion transporter [Gammaproteobacteria bacterium]|nr:SulP family inorganic anion transporter [Gammaproteobacteria bacterium]MDH3405902.1 SulP family inorganic anion transporter [Gammaproteobacteria bacterium]
MASVISPTLIGTRLRRLLPFINWIGEIQNSQVLRADLIAGITVALVLVPQSMAYAQLAGLPAYYGLYAAFMPPLVAALFGSSRQLATGPVAVVSLLTAAALEPIAATGSSGYIAYAITLSLLVGIFQLALGLLRLGVVVNFLSHPVIIGFTNAAAIIIATSQLDKIFGVRIDKAEHHYETVWNTILAIGHQLHWPTLLFGIGAFAIMIALRRINPRIPNVLVAVAITTVISYFIGFEHLRTVTVAQFESESVSEVINDQAKLKQVIPALDRAVAAAEKNYLDALSKHGVDNSRTLATLHNLDTLKLRRDRRIKSAKADLDEIKNQRFRYVPGVDGAEGRFYHVGQVPNDAVTDERLWLVRSIDGDKLLMNGGGNVVGKIPKGLPTFALPTFDSVALLQLLSAAITISLIGFMEAISIAKAMATKTRHRLDANQELIGQGLGNIVGSLTMSYPTSGSFSRSAVNINSGAITGFSSVVTSAIVIVTLLWLTPLLYHLPQATLAAVIMMAVIGLINVKAIQHAWNAHRQDGVVAMITFALTLAFAPHLDKGILIGAGLALILYLYRTMQPRVAVLARHPDGTLRDAELFGLDTCKNITMIRFDGSLYFANTSYFEDKLQERIVAKPDLKYVIVLADGINQVDATGEEMLTYLSERLRAADIEVLFVGTKRQVLDVFERTGLYEKIGAENFFRTEEQVLEHVWKKLGNNHEVDCPLNIVCALTPAK